MALRGRNGRTNYNEVLRMAFLHSKTEAVERLTGLSLKGTMLTTTQYHDRRHVLPFVLEKDGKGYFIVRQMDNGNIEGAGFNALPQVRFGSYFFPSGTVVVHGTAAKAVLSVTKDEPVKVDDAMPVSVYNELKAATTVTVQSEGAKPVEVFMLTPEQVLSKFNHHRDDVVRVVNELTAGHPQYERLNKLYANREGDVFGILEEKAKAKGLGAMLASWLSNFQELTGLRATLTEEYGYAALYLVEKRQTWVIVPAGDAKNYTDTYKSYENFAEAVKDLAGDAAVGIEEDTLGASRYVDMLGKGVELKDAGILFKDWRDEKIKFDIPYFVLGAMATRYAMEGAATFADLAIRANVSVTEKQVDDVFRARLDEFAKRYKLQVELKFYFVNTHAGSRTMYPSRPTDYVIHKGINSLKLDSGIFVFDDGLYHASSDIARTVTTTPEADEIFDLMETVLLEETVPGIKPGMTGEEIHRMGVDQIGAHGEAFLRTGYMPNTFSWRKDYPRDIGHSMERQETCSYHFVPGNKTKIKPGMVGCIEFHCAYNGHGMSAEDTFVMDDEGAIVISRGPEEFGPEGKVTLRRRMNRF